MVVSTDVLPIHEVEERARDIVLSLDASDYNQGSVTARWSEMKNVDQQNEAASVVHLRFLANVDESESNGGHRGSPLGTEQMESRLIVGFAYHLVPGQHAADMRLANKAAQQVAKAINRDERGDWSPRFLGISTAVNRDKGLVQKLVAFSVVHNIEV